MAIPKEKLLLAYRQMKTIREFEERVNAEIMNGQIAGFTHLYTGQEANAVGVCEHLDDQDTTWAFSLSWLTSNGRGYRDFRPREESFLDLRARRRAEAAIDAAAAAYDYAEAERARVLAELEYARAEWERARTLAERGTISDAQLDRAELALRTEEAALATADASVAVRASELDNARAELIDPSTAGFDQPAGSSCCVPVLAPVSGRVLRVLHESEGIVASGTPLIEVGDPQDLEVVVDLLSADAVKVAAGDAVLIDDWGGDGALAGVVRRVEPYAFTKVSALGIEEQRVNVVIDLTDPPARWPGLGHGFRVEVRIIDWQGEEIARLPLSALFRRGQDWAVFAAQDGHARLRVVELGHINADQAEVIGGLDDGGQVVMHPSDRIADGTPIVERRLD